MKIGLNLKALRKQREMSQEEIAHTLKMNRSTYSGYENGVAFPNIENLISFSDFFKISIDDLLKKDFSDFSSVDWSNYMTSWKEEAKGSNLRVLASLIDQNNEEMIELIPEKASAGYVSGFSDPEFMKILPTLQIPFLSKDRKHRAFSISGDSMPPVNNGSYVIGEFLQDWTQLKSGTPCIILTKEEGIVFKFVYNHLDENQSFLLVSSNPLFEPYSVSVKEILEIWKFSAYFSKELPEVQMDALQLSLSYRNLHQDVQLILEKLKS
jgi:transcriptional regulator with XRE-family HTH domain